MLIGVIGNGFVGKATNQLKCKDIEIYAYDINPEECNPKEFEICDKIWIVKGTGLKPEKKCNLEKLKAVCLNGLKSTFFEISFNEAFQKKKSHRKYVKELEAKEPLSVF